MNIQKETNGTALKIALEGRLDTMTAPQLESALNDGIENITSLEFDFTKLDYISSAGLRVLLSAQKIINKQNGKMVVRKVKPEIMEVFEITGFVDILTIE